MPNLNDQLKKILDSQPELLLDRKRLNAILNDYFPNEKDKINILLILYFEIKIHEKIIEANKTDDYFIERIARIIQREYRIELDAAKTGVNTWVYCLKNRKIPEQVNPPLVSNKNNELSEEANYPSGVYFPCGVGIHDRGFIISGVKISTNPCEHPFASIYAVIFGFLQRSLDMKEGEVYRKLENIQGQKQNYYRVYRLQILILFLVKNNYFIDNHLVISLIGWTKNEFNLALASINKYSQLICHLIKKNYQELKVSFESSASIKISTNKNSNDILIIDCKKRKNSNRNIWFENNIKYAIDNSNKKALKLLLKEAFNLEDFLTGQFEALQNILNCDDHKLCIMPTGSGKSLIYYFSAMLQPCPTLVLSPTKILIQDQIDILENKHEIDDIDQLYDHDDLGKFNLKNKLIFLTPLAFLSCGLIKNIISLNINQHISNFILDEVHCISNWSHDFRPEYLMLSFNLRYYVDKTRLLCFTATANYTVVKDILIQLDLDSTGKNIVSPIDLRKSNQHHNFSGVKSENVCLSKISDRVNHFLFNDLKNKNRQLLIFTKKKSTSEIIRDTLDTESQPHVEVFSSNNIYSYNDFASRVYKILIGDSEVGVGINLPGVTDTIHFGVPVSKSQYVQEIGRAGREENEANSEVIFQKRESLDPDLSLLLHRNTSISQIITKVKSSNNHHDLIQTYTRIFGGIESQDEYLKGVLFLFEKIRPIKNSDEVCLIIDKNKSYDDCLSQYMRYLYVLYRIGYIFNWYIVDHNIEEGKVTFLIEISEKIDLDSLKAFTSRYLLNMGDYKESVGYIKQSTSIEKIIENYIFWHYNQFLYHHREQFLEMYDFLELNTNTPSDQITNALKEYFSLSLFDVLEDSTKFNLLSIKDINLLINQGIENKVISDIQKSMENEYSSKHDFLLFLYNFKLFNNLDISRFERIVSNLSEVDFLEMIGLIDQVYINSNEVNRLLIINALCERVSLKEILDLFYNKIDEDNVYYSILSKCCNYYFER